MRCTDRAWRPEGSPGRPYASFFSRPPFSMMKSAIIFTPSPLFRFWCQANHGQITQGLSRFSSLPGPPSLLAPLRELFLVLAGCGLSPFLADTPRTDHPGEWVHRTIRLLRHTIFLSQNVLSEATRWLFPPSTTLPAPGKSLMPACPTRCNTSG